MKQELLNLIDEKDKILALAHEENSFMNISFVVYDVPEFISWKEKVRAELVNIPNKNDTITKKYHYISLFFYPRSYFIHFFIIIIFKKCFSKFHS